MSAVLELTQEAPREVWLFSRDDSTRRKVFLTTAQEDEILNTGRFEIVRGELQERTMPNPTHGRIQAELAAELRNFVKRNKLGIIYTETVFQLTDDLSRVPDVAFLSFERFPETGETEGRFYLAPDLAVEIVSPNDKLQEVTEKITEYFAAGVREVWLVEPNRKVLTVYHTPLKTTSFAIGDKLSDSAVLSALQLDLNEIFELPKRS